MGYCYSRTGGLCCDICGHSGNVRKRACPFGWCPACAACHDCYARHRDKFSAAYHQSMGCDLQALNTRLRDEEREGLLRAGKPVRCSALGKDGDTVHVLFATDRYRRECVGFYMASATYHAIPLIANATPDDYRRHGELLDAPSDFYRQAA